MYKSLKGLILLNSRWLKVRTWTNIVSTRIRFRSRTFERFWTANKSCSIRSRVWTWLSESEWRLATCERSLISKASAHDSCRINLKWWTSKSFSGSLSLKMVDKISIDLSERCDHFSISASVFLAAELDSRCRRQRPISDSRTGSAANGLPDFSSAAPFPFPGNDADSILCVRLLRRLPSSSLQSCGGKFLSASSKTEKSSTSVLEPFWKERITNALKFSQTNLSRHYFCSKMSLHEFD